jgi:hypothetical protein
LIITDVSLLLNKWYFPEDYNLLISLLDICDLALMIPSHLTQLPFIDCVDVEEVFREELTDQLDLLEVVRVQVELKLLDHLTMDSQESCNILSLLSRNIYKLILSNIVTSYLIFIHHIILFFLSFIHVNKIAQFLEV